MTTMGRTCGAILCAALLMTTGCGGPSRVVVKGKVTHEGKPISKGEIRFLPEGEGQVTGSTITDGVYEASGGNTVLSGACRVEITAMRPAKSRQDANVPFQQETQYLPAKYNTKTTLRFDVPTSGPVEKNFDLEP